MKHFAFQFTRWSLASTQNSDCCFYLNRCVMFWKFQNLSFWIVATLSLTRSIKPVYFHFYYQRRVHLRCCLMTEYDLNLICLRFRLWLWKKRKTKNKILYWNAMFGDLLLSNITDYNFDYKKHLSHLHHCLHKHNFFVFSLRIMTIVNAAASHIFIVSFTSKKKS